MSEPARLTRVIVHAGFHKTGTTTVQRCLQLNRGLLAPHAQVLLRAELAGTSTAAGLYARWRLPPLRWWLRHRLRRALRRHPPIEGRAVVISCERLSGMMPGRHGGWRYDLAPELAVETVRALRAVWGARVEVGFVYTTRDADAWTESVWRHLVRHDGMTLPFERFCDRLGDTPGLDDLADEVRARLGSAELTAGEVLRAVYPDLAPVGEGEVARDRAVIGLGADQGFARARCCQPLPGERIVGITHRGQGVVIHAIDCETLSRYDSQPERWLDLHWHTGKHPAVYAVTLDLTIGNDAGVLGRICTLIGEQKANISDLTFVDRKPDFYRLLIDVELRDAEHLHSVLSALDAEADVAAVERYRDPSRSGDKREEP